MSEILGSFCLLLCSELIRVYLLIQKWIKGNGDCRWDLEEKLPGEQVGAWEEKGSRASWRRRHL